MKKTYSQWRQDLIFNKKFLWNHFQFRKTYCFTNVSRWRFKFKFEKPSSKTRREKPAMLCRSYSSIRWQKTVWIWDRWQDWWHFSTIASSLKNCDIQKNPMNRDIYQVVILKQSSQAQSLVWVGKNCHYWTHLHNFFLFVIW